MANSAGTRLQATGVRYIHAENVRVERAGRVLLSIPTIRLGDFSCTVIVGPNGAGKSLLVRTLCALMKPDSGRIFWGNSPPDKARRHRVGLLLQRPVLLKRSAMQNIAYALRARGMSHSDATYESRQLLDNAGLATVAHVQAHRLSGGEQQRVALVRALALKPDMLFLDEATANVDPASTLVIEQQLLSAMEAGLQIVMVSHDVGQVRRLAKEVVLMHNGQLVEQSRRDIFFERSSNSLSRRWLAGEILV